MRRLPGAAGIRTALLPKATRGAKVVALIALRLGDEKSLFGRELAGDAAASMLARGTERLTREELATAFEKLQTSWSVGGGASGVVLRLETTRDNLAPSLALASEVLRTPRFDAREFEQMKTAWISDIESERSEPRALLQQRLQRHGNPYPKGDPRYVMTFDETLAEIAALKLDDVRAFYRQFYGASNAAVTAVGDFDPASLQRPGAEGSGRLDQQDRLRPGAAAGVRRPSGRLPDRGQGQAERRHQRPAAGAVARGRARIPGAASGGADLRRLAGSGRLWDRVREKDGLSYGVGGSLSGGQFNRHADWSLFAIAAPQNVAGVRAAFAEETARARREGFSAAELERAKGAIAASSRLARAQDASLATALESFVERSKTPAYFAELDALRAQITLDEVNAAFRKYVVPEKMVFGVAGDFSNAAAAAAATKAAGIAAPAPR